MTKEKGRILIVDDDSDVLVTGRLVLKRHFDQVVTTNTPEKIPDLMAESGFDVVLLDMNFGVGENSGREGFRWLAKILELDAEAMVVMMTAYSNLELAVEAMKRGAMDFVSKPWRNEKLVATVSTALRLRRLRGEADSLKRRNRELLTHLAPPAQDILGHSAAIKNVLSLIARSAPTEANVLILGENGTGKELAAREIHRQSKRAGEIFMAVDLGAVSESLFESELFGHKKGAFTDAREDRIGRLQAAHGGTLFLDEVGNLPLHLQAKLLTVLEQRRVLPVGANQSVDIDVRLISATNLAPERLADEHIFRQDLLYRLNTVEISVPPLRERTADIPMLIENFAAVYARKYGRPDKPISEDAMKTLIAYAWPGNVRALKHAVERAIILSQGEVLETADFSLSSPSSALPPGSATAELATLDLDELERQAVERALKTCQGNISRAAKLLGITRNALYRRLEKHDL